MLKKFLDLDSPDELAELLGLDYQQLATVIYGYPSAIKYKVFKIKKRSGDDRIICAPCKKLKQIQKKLSELLYLVYKQKKPAHGFCKDRSVVSNARQHLEKRYIFNLDLEDFFGAIHFGRVKNMFMKKPYWLPRNVAIVIAHICCHNNTLPQGAPTSPIISNMIAKKLDSNLSSLAARHYATYTRYADDITFSFTCLQKNIPKEIICFAGKGISLGDELERIIQNNGFTINYSKVRLCRHKHRLEVTGLTVNEFLNVKRSYIQRIKSMLFAWEKFDIKAAEEHYIKKYGATHRERASGSVPSFERVLCGKINYLKMVRGADDRICRRLAYRYSVCIGKPREDLNDDDPHSFISNNLYYLSNEIDEREGTAFLLKGYGILTSNHIVENLPQDGDLSGLIKMHKFNDKEKKINVKIVRRSTSQDWAILKIIDTSEDIKRYGLSLGDSSTLTIGSKITLCGLPEHSTNSSPYFEKCDVTQKRAYLGYTEGLLVSGRIVHGLSGGPVLNQKNEVVGIVTFGRETAAEATDSIFNGFMPLCLT